MALTAEDILNQDDRLRTEINIPEWGGTVTVVLPGPFEWPEEIDALEKLTTSADKKESLRAAQRIAALTAIASVITLGDGTPMFSMSDAEELAQRNPAALMRIRAAVLDLQRQENQLIEEIAKNFAPTAGDASGTASPSTKATDTPK